MAKESSIQTIMGQNRRGQKGMRSWVSEGLKRMGKQYLILEKWLLLWGDEFRNA